MSFIKMDNISFTYPDGTQAVENLSLFIGKGESVAIIGQNGEGKNTAVKMLNGLLKPSEGDVIIDDWNSKE